MTANKIHGGGGGVDSAETHNIKSTEDYTWVK
jgi:hypothetical protein